MSFLLIMRRGYHYEKNNRFFKLFALCLPVIMTLLLCACSFGEDSSSSGVILSKSFEGVSTDKGYFMTGNINGELFFYDYETKQTVPICNKPDCTHEDPETCAAYVMTSAGLTAQEFIVYGDYIYYFAPESFTEMSIIRTNLDNTNRITIAKDEISGVYSIAAVNNKLYYFAGLSVYSEDGEDIIGSIQNVHCLDLETNKVSVIVNPEKDLKRRVFFEGIGSEYLYYYEPLLGDGVETTVIDGEEHEVTERLEVNLKKCSLSTLEETVIADARDFVFDYYDVNSAYFVIKKGEKEYDICELDYASGELNKLFTSDQYITYIVADKDRVLCASKEANVSDYYERKNCILFDKRTKKTSEVHFTDENFCTFGCYAEYGDYLIGNISFKDSEGRAIVNKDAFFEGRIEYEMILENPLFTPNLIDKAPDDEAENDEDDYVPQAYDSNKLVWLTDMYNFSEGVTKPRLVTMTEEDRFYQLEGYGELINLLKENGIDKEIEMKQLVLPEEYNITYALEDILNSGEQIDIISYRDQPLSCLLDLTEYFNTESGETVKAAVSENVWRGLGEPDGKRYFVPMRRVLQGEQNGYKLNDELMKKNGLTESDLAKSFGELGAVFEKLDRDGFGCFLPGDELSSAMIYPRFRPVDSRMPYPFLMIDTDKPGAMVENIYENPECAENLKTLRSWKEKNFIANPEGQRLVWDSRYYENKNSDDADYKVTPVGEAYADHDVRGRSLAIAKTSQNADVAFQVLALTVTNDEISAALNPYQFNIAAPEDELKMYDSFGFYPDFSPVKKEYEACKAVLQRYFHESIITAEQPKMPDSFGDVWHGEMPDVDLGLKGLNAELKAAGLDKILAELNAQLTEFYSNHK